MSTAKRKDKSRVVLRSGEAQRTNGSYQYSWMDDSGKRRFVYAKTLEELRIKEEQIEKDKSDGIKLTSKPTSININNISDRLFSGMKAVCFSVFY